MSGKPPMKPPVQLADRRLTPGDRALIEQALPRITKMAKGFHVEFRWMPEDDFYGAGALKLTAITPNFDPSIHPEFAGFFYLPVRGAMLDLVRKPARDRRVVALYLMDQRLGVVMTEDQQSTEAFMSTEPDDERAKRAKLKRYFRERAAALILAAHYERAEAAAGQDPERTLEYEDTIACLEQEVSKLDERAQRVVKMLHEEGATLDEAAATLDVSKKTIQRVHTELRENLEKALTKRGITSAPERP